MNINAPTLSNLQNPLSELWAGFEPRHTIWQTIMVSYCTKRTVTLTAWSTTTLIYSILRIRHCTTLLMRLWYVPVHVYLQQIEQIPTVSPMRQIRTVRCVSATVSPINNKCHAICTNTRNPGAWTRQLLKLIIPRVFKCSTIVPSTQANSYCAWVHMHYIKSY